MEGTFLSGDKPDKEQVGYGALNQLHSYYLPISFDPVLKIPHSDRSQNLTNAQKSHREQTQLILLAVVN